MTVKNMSEKILNKIIKDCNILEQLIIKCIEYKYGQISIYLPSINIYPKKRQNAYTIFCSKYRDKIKKDNPNKNFSNISKIIGQKWNLLNKKEKEKYRDNAIQINKINSDNVSNNTDINIDNNNNLIDLQMSINKQIAKLIRTLHNILFEIIVKDISKKYNITRENIVLYIPYKNKKYKKNSYTVFSSEHRNVIKQKYPNKKFGEISKIVGQMWKKLTKEQKQYYKNKAIEENNNMKTTIIDLKNDVTIKTTY